MRPSVLMSVVVVGMAASAAEAQVITRNTSDRGWYGVLGLHDSVNKNYNVGNFTADRYPLRNFFVVNLSGVTDTILSARLLLQNPSDGFLSPEGTETYSLFDSTTPIAELSASQSNRTDIFADLGSGAVFGTIVATSALNGSNVSISLNAAGLASLNAARGGLWSVGGAITTINGAPGQSREYLFGFTNDASAADGLTRLELTIPSPTAAGVLGWRARWRWVGVVGRDFAGTTQRGLASGFAPRSGPSLSRRHMALPAVSVTRAGWIL